MCEVASISGSVTLCNNNNCGEIISDSIEVEIVRYPAGQKLRTLFSAICEYDPRDSIKDILTGFIFAKIREKYPNRFEHLFELNIQAQSLFTLDTLQLCGECQGMYDEFGLGLNARPHIVNIKQSGFPSELSIKNAIAKKWGFDSFTECHANSSDHGKSVFSACRTGYRAIAYDGLNFKEALKMASEQYIQKLNYYKEQENKTSRTVDQLSKDPDKMSDEEWYDHIETLSDDPVWKETVREQRKAKGIAD
jgi:hypothetical protein